MDLLADTLTDEQIKDLQSQLSNEVNERKNAKAIERRSFAWYQCKESLKDIAEIMNNYEMGLINPLHVNDQIAEILKINAKYYKKIGVTQSDLCNNF